MWGVKEEVQAKSPNFLARMDTGKEKKRNEQPFVGGGAEG